MVFLAVGTSVTKWKDKRKSLSSTMLISDLVEVVNNSGTAKLKPNVTQTFVQHITGIDISDQILPHHSALRKTNRYKKVMSIHIVEILVFCNAYCMYTKSTEVPTVKNVKEFREMNRSFRKPSYLKLQANLHYLLTIPPKAKKKDTASTCKHCSTKEKWKESRYEYLTSPDGPALCMDPCFSMFHLSLHLVLIPSSFTVCRKVIDKPFPNWLRKSSNCYSTYYLLLVALVLLQR